MQVGFDPNSTVFCISAQHTGTWFTIDTLRQHRDVVFIEWVHTFMPSWRRHAGSPPLPDWQSRPEGSTLLLHAHVYGSKSDGSVPQAGQPNYLSRAAFDDVASRYRVVVPIRDPLRSVITRHVRAAGLRHMHIVNAMKMFARRGAGGNVFWLPIDTGLSQRARQKLLGRLYRHVKLSRPPGLAEWAARWQAPAASVSPPHELQQRYADGDFAAIRRAIPKEVAALQADVDTLRPFLEKQGYRDLMWW